MKETRIFKYVVPMDETFVLKLPAGAVPLHFGMQNGDPCLWARVVESAPMQDYKFRFAGTGHVVAGGWTYIGTTFDREFVWHLFWEKQA